MSLFLAKYYIRWVATSHDEKMDKLHKVIIESKSFNDSINTITKYEEENNQYTKIEFISIEKLDEIVLWK